MVRLMPPDIIIGRKPFQASIHPRSQGLTADTALPEALAKTKTRSDLIGRMKSIECGN
jgi:hypothetical protein